MEFRKWKLKNKWLVFTEQHSKERSWLWLVTESSWEGPAVSREFPLL